MQHQSLLRHALAALCAIAVVIFISVPVLAADWRVGDLVQGYDTDWYDATILEVGSGDHAGEYRIKYDRFAGEKWLSAASIRARPGAPADDPAPVASGFQPGVYACYGYPGTTGTFRWYLVFDNDAYQQRTPDLAPGRYGIDAPDAAMMFFDGPYAGNGWYGQLRQSGERTEVVLRAIADEQQGPRVNEYANIYCSPYSN